MSVNKVILIGNLGGDPEFKDVGTGLAKFTMATSETYKTKDGEKKTETQWHNVSAWGKLAEIVSKYLKKGSKVYVEGKLTYHMVEDADGNKKYFTEIKIDFGGKLEMLDSKEGAKTAGEHIKETHPELPQAEPISGKATPPEDDEDDLPF
jgi:single-strand DNA-binding protein